MGGDDPFADWPAKIQFTFNEEKAAQAASHVINACGGTVPYMSLIKMLYLADRRCLIERGQPITGDKWYSMPKGPILSQVLDLLRLKAPLADGTPGACWRTYVNEPFGKLVSAGIRSDDGELSDYEIRVLDEVVKENGRKNRWALVDETHPAHAARLAAEPPWP